MMTDGYYVSLNTSNEIVFPSACIVCGIYDEKVEHDSMQSQPVGYFGDFVWMLGLGKKLNIPVHSNCKKQLKKSRTSLFISISIAAMCILFYFDIDMFYVASVLILLSLVSSAIQVKSCPTFEFSVHGDDTFQFRFKSKRYAEEFAELNGGKVK